MKRTIYVGFDPREVDAYSVTMGSLTRRLSDCIPAHPLQLNVMVALGHYRRPTERRDIDGRNVLWDTISGAPMSTEHAITRFLVKELAGSGWVLFMDGDMLVRGDLCALFDGLDPAKAVYCVHHRHDPDETAKMDGQVQTRYARKNWSSLMAINCDHPANAALTVDLVNTVPGRDLHRFCWLEDDAVIGELGPEWNWLAPAFAPKVVHFTAGVPNMPGYENAPFADEWRAELARYSA